MENIPFVLLMLLFPLADSLSTYYDARARDLTGDELDLSKDPSAIFTILTLYIIVGFLLYKLWQI